MDIKHLLTQALNNAEQRVFEAEEEKRVFEQILREKSCPSKDFLFYENKINALNLTLKHLDEVKNKIKKQLSAC
jgi:hypothetical protein